MEKLELTAAQRTMLRKFNDIIKTGDVNKMLDWLAKLMADGLTPNPRQIAKVSAYVYKVGNEQLITEFGIKYAGLGSFTSKLEEVVLERGTAEDNFDFAQYVPGADIVAHGRVIKKRRNKMWWVAFARLFPEQARFITQENKKEQESEAQAYR